MKTAKISGKLYAGIIILVILATAVGGAWFFTRPAGAADSPLTASGTIEATTIQLSPQVGGRVTDVLLDEGQSVKAGQQLLKIDDSALQAQYAQAQAALLVAQANLALLKAGASPEQRQAAVTNATLGLTSAQQALDDLYKDQEMQSTQLLQTIATTDKQLDTAKKTLDNLNTAADPNDINAAWDAVVLAKDRLDKANDNFRPFANKSPDNVGRAYLQSKVTAAQTQYDNLVTRYNNLIGKANQYDLEVAEANVKALEAKLKNSRDQYADMQNGPDPETLKQAQDRLSAAQAALAVAKAGPSKEQLAVAQAQVQQAQAQVQSIEVQLKNILMNAPSDGIVLTRNIEPGELASPGAVLFEIGQLNNLEITVYLPEEQFALVNPGEQAKVKVDAYPNKTFTATVLRIADQAEFTPRNVQTVDERKNTVFAVRLSIANPDLAIKPGMPADVTFGQ